MTLEARKAFNNRARALIDQGLRLEAVAVLREGVTQFPDDGILHYSLGHTFSKLAQDTMRDHGQADRAAKVQEYRGQALDHYMASADLRPNDFMSAFMTAVMAKRMAQNATGFDYARKAVQMKPNDAPVWGVLGELYEATGDMASAIGCYRNVLRLKPHDLAAREGLQRNGASLAFGGDVDYSLVNARRRSGPQ